jgi:hypothetical protein
MATHANRNLQIVEHEGVSYLLLPRARPSSFDIVRLRDQLGVGAVWLTRGSDPGFRHAATGSVSRSDIREIVVAGIRGGLFA